MFCINDKICNICAGDLFYILNIKNIGLTSVVAPNTVMNISMKAFHDQTVKRKKLDWKNCLY